MRTRFEVSGVAIPDKQGQKWLFVCYQVELPAVRILMEMLDLSDKGQDFLVQLAVVPLS